MKRIFALLVGVLALCAPAAARAQSPVRPHLHWRTLRTEHFEIHFPVETTEWVRDFAGRIEAVHASVAAEVGSAPGRRTTVLVEDPYGQANGSAFSLLQGPVIVVWPTPPDPRSVLGHNRGQPEQLAVHEFTHVAQLTRPSRNPRARLLGRLLPGGIGPLARTAPRWVKEGYATYVEGRLTGSGRPYGVYRAAVLRQWALEGRLPTYGQMSAGGGFQGGAMAYLVGSAFLEWLVEQRGEASLGQLWRRMSARQPRTFADAFAGVYGGPPDELYGRFTVDVTARALEARRLLAERGIVAGDTVQRLAGDTGDPALSPDGKQLAIALAPGSVPGRVVVWSTRERLSDSVERAARDRLLRLDPEDVPAIRWRPRPLRVLATLPAAAGLAYDEPRFLPGGEEILVTRLAPLGDGAYRRDLFAWRWRRGGVRRVTHGASVSAPDPAPDGRSAAAVRCQGGVCDLVRVDLASGAVSVIAPGDPRTVWYRPRWSPDGRWIVAAVQERGRWRLARVDPAGGGRTYLDPDDGASRYDAAFLPGGDSLVATSERGGIADLEVLDARTGHVRPLTRVTGAAVAPAPDPTGRGVYFLTLHPGGYDLHRIRPDSARPGEAAPLPTTLAPVAARVPAAPADTFARAPLPPVRPYGIGPQRLRLLPGGSFSPDGAGALLVLVGTDPVGRLSWMAQGTWGEPGTWRGGSLRAVWRGWRPSLGVDVFAARQEPAESAPTFDPSLRLDYRGAALAAEQTWSGAGWGERARLGGSAGRVDDDSRTLAWAEYALAARRSTRWRLGVSGALNGALGRTGAEAWRRAVASAALSGRAWGIALRGDAVYGTGDAAPGSRERFAVGGLAPALLDPALLSQRIPMPGLPTGAVTGASVVTLRGSATVGGATPYLWAGRATDGGDDWHRVVGVEQAFSSGAVPYLRIPDARVLAGAAYSLDPPFRDRARVYLSVTYRP